MTANEIIRLAFSMVGVKPTNELLTEYSGLMLDGINGGYVEICGNYRLTTWESVVLDSSKQFLVSALGKTCSDIVKVSENKDFSDAAGFVASPEYKIDMPDREHVTVVDADPNQTVWVQYRYIPELLVSTSPLNTDGTGSTSPIEIPAQYHPVLANKAAAAYWRSLNNYDRVDEFEGRFSRDINRMTEFRAKTPRTVISTNSY